MKEDILNNVYDGSLFAFLVYCGLDKGFTISDMAVMNGYNEKSLRNWATRNTLSDGAILNFIESIDLSFEDARRTLLVLAPRSVQLDPKIMKRQVGIEKIGSELSRFKTLPGTHIAKSDHKTNLLFMTGFLKEYGGQCFEAAFRKGRSSIWLCIQPKKGGDTKGWESFRGDSVDGRNICNISLLENLGYTLDSDYLSISLPEICSSFPLLYRNLSLQFPDFEFVLKSELDHRADMAFIIQISWEVYRWGEDFTELAYCFYWFSDIDGKSFVDLCLSEVKRMMREEESSLVFYIHEGYFTDQAIKTDRDISLSKYISSRYKKAGESLSDFEYDNEYPDYDLGYDFSIDLEDGLELRKVFFANSKGLITQFITIPMEIPLIGIQRFFSTFGYKLKFGTLANNHRIYRLVLSWD